MANFKLVLEDDFGEDFSLIAIHCSAEAYKMAYLLNDHMALRLKRKRVDLDLRIGILTCITRVPVCGQIPVWLEAVSAPVGS